MGYVRICEPSSAKGGKDGGKGKGKDGKGKGKGGKGKGGPGNKPEGCTSLVIKFMASETTEDKLWTFFEDKPSSIKLLTDRDSGESKCVAFVDFEDTAAMDECVKKNDETLDGKTVMVAYNAPKGDGDKGKGKGKDGKDGKGKGKKGDSAEYAARSANAGAIAAFQGEAKTF